VSAWVVDALQLVVWGAVLGLPLVVWLAIRWRGRRR
jgi:hypothetical protein